MPSFSTLRRCWLSPALVALAVLTAPLPALPEEAKPAVDVLLALGVDISYSMDEDEQYLQRNGYMDALLSKQVLDGIAAGIHGRIGIAYYEWAGTGERRTIVPWTIIDGAATAQAFVDKLRSQPYRRASRTSLSGAIDYGVGLLEDAPLSAPRRVIDISGDGPNNHGRPVEIAREEALAQNIVINGLPIIFQRRFNSSFDIDNLDQYYSDCVIGGYGSFVIAISNQEQFSTATRQKLLREIAETDPPARIVPIAERSRADCMVGEKMWQRRFGGD
ncbi:MAG: DUF1194 domain-containing protein [Beijerinckiaceae bacterium]|nr:DUF1194 domain-containing protein [Beijerinckiaceae bacterium]